MVVFSYTEVVWKVTEQKIYFVVFVLFSKYLVQVFFPMIVENYQVISCHTFYYRSHL